MKIPKNVMIHHSGVSWNINPDQFLANNSYHQKLWHFRSSLGYYLGYNYEISKYGKVYKARAAGERTAACYQGGMNDGRCIHVCLDGNFEVERPVPNQIYALRDLLRELKLKFPFSSENIFFHRQFSNTVCPGKSMDLNFIRRILF
jgi:N-acetylmuramoyl-L-alanine amidase